jgi:hypothetical protein
MRITVLILTLILGAIMSAQTFLVYGLSSAVNDQGTSESGAVGLMMALLWLVAAAFVIPRPIVSVIAFVIAGLFGFAASGDFPDLAVWGGISLALALLSFFGWRGKRKDDLEARREKARQLERDQLMEEMMRERVH